MSKRIVRVIFSVLITLILVAGIYSSVYGASVHAGAQNAHAQVGANLSYHRVSASGMDSADASDDLGQGGCHHDSMINPEDY